MKIVTGGESQARAWWLALSSSSLGTFVTLLATRLSVPEAFGWWIWIVLALLLVVTLGFGVKGRPRT